MNTNNNTKTSPFFSIKASTHSRVAVKIISILGVFTIIALIAERYPLRFDVTKTGEHSLSERSLEVIEGINELVKITGFYQEGQDEAIGTKYLLDAYKYYSNKIKYSIVDPDQKPAVAKSYGVEKLNTLAIEGKGKKYLVEEPDEEKITNTILKILRGELKKLYFLTGHGEKSIDNTDRDGFSNLKMALEKENYPVATIELSSSGDIPEDASLVVVGGPQKALFPGEVEALKRYLKRGGKVILLIDPQKESGLEPILTDYGLTPGEKLIYDEVSQSFTGDPLSPVVTKYGPHKITRGFELVSIFPLSMSIYTTESVRKGIRTTPLVFSSSQSWEIDDLSKLFSSKGVPFKEGQDRKGPFPIAFIAETIDKKPDEEEKKKGDKLVVFGDSDFANNSYLTSTGNIDLLLNIINYMVESEGLITIKPREKENTPLVLTKKQGTLLFLVSIVFAPILLFSSAMIATFIRRKGR